MERDQLQLTDEKLSEDLVVLSYSIQEELPVDMVFEGLKFDMYPPENFFNDEVSGEDEVLYLGFAAGAYDGIPDGLIEDETVYLINNLYNFKNKYRKAKLAEGDYQAAEVVGEISVEGFSEFVKSRHMDYLHQALEENESGKIDDWTMGRLIFWSKLDEIAEKAIGRLDPDLDLDKDLV